MNVPRALPRHMPKHAGESYSRLIQPSSGACRPTCTAAYSEGKRISEANPNPAAESEAYSCGELRQSSSLE